MKKKKALVKKDRIWYDSPKMKYPEEAYLETERLAVAPWRRKWHPTPVFLPGKSRELGSLVGCRLWGRTESDTAEAT